MTDFPFTIIDVINACSISAKYKGDRIYFDCPICGGHNKVQARISSGVYNCIKCGQFKGGILGLYQYFHNCDSKAANRAMREYVGQPTYSAQKAKSEHLVKTAKSIVEQNARLAPKHVINATYRRFLSLCVLSNTHRESLHARGLSDQHIAHFGFKSVPISYEERNQIVETLVMEGYRLEGVPGFYVNRGKWDINLRHTGILIPYISLQNKLLGFQVRLDKPIKEQRKDGTIKLIRYLWVTSTDLNNGCSRSTIPHITSTKKVERTIFFTEGALKADVASALSERTFVAIAGVTQYSILPALFNQLRISGVKHIVDCFDADYKRNPNVAAARQRLKEEVLKANLQYFRLDWDESDGKGIDDFLFNVPRGQRKYKLYDY